MPLPNEFDYNRSKSLLDAVNVMLNAIGETDVQDEDEILEVYEAVQAYKDLIQVKREVLSSGWECNTDDNYTFLPDTNNQIVIPSNVLSVSSTDADITTRDNFLYSKKRMSTVFEEEAKVSVIWDLEFNTIPVALRWYITLKAVRRFRDRVIGADSIAHSFTELDERDAYMEARRVEALATSANMLNPAFDINRV